MLRKYNFCTIAKSGGCRGGLVLSRLFELGDEVFTFLQENQSPLAEHFHDADFQLKLAYLADIFGEMNGLNKSMHAGQGHLFVQHDR